MRALFVLTPAESKRLIGKAVAELQEVKYAQKNEKILIGHGSTNFYVAEEIMGKQKITKMWKENKYLSGAIQKGTLCTIIGEEKPPLLILNRGVVIPPADTMNEVLRDFGRDSVFIKGGNAVDPEGNAAAFIAHPEGGTIGWAFGTLMARGIRLIAPVGLEKLVPSVARAATYCGQETLDYCQGLRVGLIPLTGAKVVTEITALKILAGADAVQVAAGGHSGSEGAVMLVVDAEKAVVQKSIRIIESVKGEPPIITKKYPCLTCIPKSPVQPKGYKYEDWGSEVKRAINVVCIRGYRKRSFPGT